MESLKEQHSQMVPHTKDIKTKAQGPRPTVAGWRLLMSQFLIKSISKVLGGKLTAPQGFCQVQSIFWRHHKQCNSSILFTACNFLHFSGWFWRTFDSS